MVNVNDQCIGCGTCVAIDDKLFKMEGTPPKAKLLKQPETPDELKKYDEAKAACPVGAIE